MESERDALYQELQALGLMMDTAQITVDEHGLSVYATDPNIPYTYCISISHDFQVTLYSKVTGSSLRKIVSAQKKTFLQANQYAVEELKKYRASLYCYNVSEALQSQLTKIYIYPGTKLTLTARELTCQYRDHPMTIKIEFDNNVVHVTLTASKSLMSHVNREYSHNYPFSADIASDVIAKMREFAGKFDAIPRPRPPDRMQEAPPSQPLAARTSWAVQQIEAIEHTCPKTTYEYYITLQGDDRFEISLSTRGLSLRCGKKEKTFWQGVSTTYSLNEITYDNHSLFIQDIVSYIKTGDRSPPLETSYSGPGNPRANSAFDTQQRRRSGLYQHINPSSAPLVRGFVLSAPALETLERFVSVMGL